MNKFQIIVICIIGLIIPKILEKRRFEKDKKEFTQRLYDWNRKRFNKS